MHEIIMSSIWRLMVACLLVVVISPSIPFSPKAEIPLTYETRARTNDQRPFSFSADFISRVTVQSSPSFPPRNWNQVTIQSQDIQVIQPCPWSSTRKRGSPRTFSAISRTRSSRMSRSSVLWGPGSPANAGPAAAIRSNESSRGGPEFLSSH